MTGTPAPAAARSASTHSPGPESPTGQVTLGTGWRVMAPLASGPGKARLDLMQSADMALNSQGEPEIEVGDRWGWEGAGVLEPSLEEEGPEHLTGEGTKPHSPAPRPHPAIPMGKHLGKWGKVKNAASPAEAAMGEGKGARGRCPPHPSPPPPPVPGGLQAQWPFLSASQEEVDGDSYLSLLHPHPSEAPGAGDPAAPSHRPRCPGPDGHWPAQAWKEGGPLSTPWPASPSRHLLGWEGTQGCPQPAQGHSPEADGEALGPRSLAAGACGPSAQAPPPPAPHLGVLGPGSRLGNPGLQDRATVPQGFLRLRPEVKQRVQGLLPAQ